MVAFRYERLDPDLLRRTREFQDLLRLFQDLVLQAGGDAERALGWLKRLQELGHLPGRIDLQDFRDRLVQEGFVHAPAGFPVLTPKGERSIRQDALARVFGGLAKAGRGEHRIPRSGEGGERLPETRPWADGDDVADLDAGRTLHNALRRSGIEMRIGEADFEVSEREHHASCATVLLLDVSHSMILYGEDRITPAKRVALALAELIETRYPKDSLQVALFGDHAQEIRVRDLLKAGAGPYHTNTKEALQLARRLLLRKRHANRQIFMVTDGKPSAINEGAGLYRNPFGLDPKIVNATLEEASECRRRRIPVTTFMLTRDPALVEFVDTLTRINRGRAYYASPDDLGDVVFVDFMRNRKAKLGY
jgi:uncharacterized protein with von Willebrand factor type A (vWA) domain